MKIFGKGLHGARWGGSACDVAGIVDAKVRIRNSEDTQALFRSGNVEM